MQNFEPPPQLTPEQQLRKSLEQLSKEIKTNLKIDINKSDCITNYFITLIQVLLCGDYSFIDQAVTDIENFYTQTKQTLTEYEIDYIQQTLIPRLQKDYGVTIDLTEI